MGILMIFALLIPLRVIVFLIGFTAYRMEIAADWIIGARSWTEYVREGSCKRCGRCCRCLALVMPKGVSSRDWMVRVARLWHEIAMNFKSVAEDAARHSNDGGQGWLIYRCGYYRDGDKEAPGHCSIYRFRHRLCRFFPRQGVYGHPSLHPDCGYSFVRRDVWERRRKMAKEGRHIFDDFLNTEA